MAGGTYPAPRAATANLAGPTTKPKLGLTVYGTPEQLQRAIEAPQHWSSHERDREALGNLRSTDICAGRGEAMARRRRGVKRRTLTSDLLRPAGGQRHPT